jgi:hypothetical protein
MNATPRPASVPPDGLPKTSGEALTRFARAPSAIILAGLFAGVLAARLWLGGWSWVDAAIMLGVLAYWPINEWLIHVYFLHQPVRRIGRLRWQPPAAREHKRHHGDPWNLRWVFIPLQVFPFAIPLLALAFVVLPPAPALSFLVAYLALSLHYEWVHYLAHIRWCPPLAYYQSRVREHRLHHFRHERKWWGVSMGLGDRLLGTAPDPATTPRSPHTATLGRP